MKIKLLITIFFTTLFLSNTAFGQQPNFIFVDCFHGENGKGIANRSDNARGRDLITTRGNNGKGNGGESANIWILPNVVPDGTPLSITVECINTENEDTGGRTFLWLHGPQIWLDIGPSVEFDPGQ